MIAVAAAVFAAFVLSVAAAFGVLVAAGALVGDTLWMTGLVVGAGPVVFVALLFLLAAWLPGTEFGLVAAMLVAAAGAAGLTWFAMPPPVDRHDWLVAVAVVLAVVPAAPIHFLAHRLALRRRRPPVPTTT